MSLALDIRPETVTATLHYTRRTGRRPVRYVGTPPPGEPEYSGIDDPHDLRIEDARGREAEFDLDRNGFQLVAAPTLVTDFYSTEEVRRTYYPEVERLLRENLGASRVVVFDHTVRNAGRADARKPARTVHNDHTVNSAPRRVRDHLGPEADQLLRHRFGVINVWRPIRGPVLDSPLALCDARTFTDDDLIASDLVYPHLRGETYAVEYKPDHRWYYFSRMQPDEALLIRVHDSANDGAPPWSARCREDPRDGAGASFTIAGGIDFHVIDPCIRERGTISFVLAASAQRAPAGRMLGADDVPARAAGEARTSKPSLRSGQKEKLHV
jgi:hypothetical protein